MSHPDPMLESLLKATVDSGASDLHLTVGRPATARRDGVLVSFENVPVLTSDEVDRMVYSLLDERKVEELRRDRQVDFSFGVNGLGRFRANAFRQRGHLALALRVVPFRVRTLEELGAPRACTTLLNRPYGIVLVVGPTGSGKSTTLYATLNAVARSEVNIVTVEDPVEYRIPGINQIQTHAKAGLTFAAALRSILRADPDVILIGEIRDHETAQIAIESALTGHLVLTTLHTNDAPSVITRLSEMGIEPFLVASALQCATGQRLARRLCTKCRAETEKSPAELAAVQFELPPGIVPTFYEPVGCSSCAGTGYRGRLAMHEVMMMSEELGKLAVRNASSEEVRSVAIDQGMRTLRQDGWLKVAQGLTTIGEVLRVIS